VNGTWEVTAVVGGVGMVAEVAHDYCCGRMGC
jgi:hypothetical protein